MKKNRKTLKAGLSLALISFFAPSVFAAGVSTDTDDLSTPTLTGLAELNNENGTSYPESAYKLTDVTTYLTADDLDTDGNYIGTTYDIVIKKYLENADGSLTAVYYSVDVDSDAKYYGKTGTAGAAISNSSSSYGAITADFISNKITSTSSYLYGGAIYNKGTITSITGDFINNSACSSYNYNAKGGAIYNANGGVIGDITGDFIGNYLDGYYLAYGGAICNEPDFGTLGTIGNITGDFISNYAKATTTSAMGGAIYNYSIYNSMGNISGNFIGNYVETISASFYAEGGAIFNRLSSIDSISGTFVGNYALAKMYAYGGAIFNSNASDNTVNDTNIGYIEADFSGNYVSSESYASGGAIYNTGIIGYIDGNFDSNYAYSKSGNALGGAICNTYYGVTYFGYLTEGIADVGYIKGSFTSNFAETDSGWAAGGAIYNYESTLETVNANFDSNYAKTASYWAEGGAIYNDYGTIIVEGNFTNNYAVGANTTGGAVTDYKGTMTFTANTQDVYNYGNWAGSSEALRDDENGGFLYMYDSEVTFNIATTDYSMVIGYEDQATYDEYDSIVGTGVIYKTGLGTLTVNSSMQYYTGSLFISAGDMIVNNLLGASSVSILEDASLSIDASNILSSSVSNAGTLYLSGSYTGDYTLSAAITGTGSIVITDGSNISAVANYLGNAVTNYGTLYLTGNGVTLSSVITGGSVHIGSDSVIYSNASNFVASVYNNGTLYLTGTSSGTSTTGILSSKISGSSDAYIIIEDGYSIATSASNFEYNKVTNNGSLYLQGGELSVAISGTGIVEVNGSSTVTINSGSIAASLLTITADKLVLGTITAVESALDGVDSIVIASTATLELNIDSGTSATFSSSLSSEGAVSIASGDITFADSVVIEGGNLTIASGASLSTSADALKTTESTKNNGTLNLTGGTLTSDIAVDNTATGTAVNIQGDVALSSSVTTGTLTVEEGNSLSVSGTLVADIVVQAGADLNVVITSENAGETILSGDITYSGSDTLTIDISFDDIFSVLGTTTTIYDSTSTVSGDVELSLGDYITDYEGISFSSDGFSVEVDDSVTLMQSTTVEDEDGNEVVVESSADFVKETTADEYGNEVVNDVINVTAGDYVLDSGEQSADVVNTNITDEDTGETTSSSLVVGEDTSLSAGTLSEDSTLNVSGGSATIATAESGSTVSVTEGGEASVESLAGTAEVSGGTVEITTAESGSTVSLSGTDTVANITTVSEGASLESSEGTTSVETLAGEASVSGGETTIASVASTASVEVSGGETKVTEVASGASLSVSGGDLTFAAVDTDEYVAGEAPTEVTKVILSSSAETETAGEAVVNATSGSVTVEADNGIISLADDEYSIAQDSTLKLSSESISADAGTTTTISGAGSLELDGSLDLAEGATLAIDSNVALSEELSLSNGSTLSITGDISSTSEETETKTTISGTKDESETLALGSSKDESSSIALNTTIVAKNVENVELNGEINASQDTAIILDGDDASTVSGSATITATTAIEVANDYGKVTLDNASISSTGTALTNSSSLATSNGLNVTVKGQSSIEGNIVANSPFSLSGSNSNIDNFDVGDYDTYGDTLTVYGSITTGDSGTNDSASISSATLVLSGENASLSTQYDDGVTGDSSDDTYGSLSITSSGALLVEGGASVVVGATTVSGSTLSLDEESTMEVNGALGVSDSTVTIDNDSTLTVTGSATVEDSTLNLDNGSTLDVDGELTLTGTVTIVVENGSEIKSATINNNGASVNLEVTTTAADLLNGVVSTVMSGLTDQTLTTAYGTYAYLSASGEITATSLTYFRDAVADSSNANEMALATSLDNILASTNSDADIASAENDAKSAFKLEAEANGLASYIMSNYSQIAEVDTMLLSNQNIANVNRARSILEKSAGIQIDDEDGSISFENEDGTISVVDASEVSLIKYSNVAQLQSINMLGSKDANNGVAGYDYWSVGATANFDEILSEKALIGASIGGTYNKVEGDAGDNANSTTFLLNAYAVYANEGFEAFANIGYAHFWNEGSKAGAGSADWDSDAFNFLVGASYDFVTKLDGLTITPLAMLNLVCLESDSASYSNGVNVDDESYFSAKLMFGVEAEYAISAQFNAIARLMYAHEMGDTSYDSSYSVGFVNGIDYIGGEAGADSAIMGLGLSYDFSETCTAYFDYNAYVYSNLITHTLNLSVALKF